LACGKKRGQTAQHFCQEKRADSTTFLPNCMNLYFDAVYLNDWAAMSSRSKTLRATKHWRKRTWRYNEEEIPNRVLSSKYGEYAGRSAHVIDMTEWVSNQFRLSEYGKANHLLIVELGAPLILCAGQDIHKKVNHTSSKCFMMNI
jgi:hypothetical protein